MKNAILITVGFLSLALGIIGIVVPVLPTTGFVIIAVSCFSCTPRLRSALLKIKFFREHYENYTTRRGIPKKTLIFSLSYLWLTMIISMILVRSKLWLVLLLLAIAIAVTVHIIWVSKPKKMNRDAENLK